MGLLSWLSRRMKPPTGGDGPNPAAATPPRPTPQDTVSKTAPETAAEAHARLLREAPPPVRGRGRRPPSAATKEEDRRRMSETRVLEAEGQRERAYALLHERFIHLNAHEADDPLPCLCRRCFRPELFEVEVAGTCYAREWTEARGRVLYFWLPFELRDQARSVRSGIAARLFGRLRRWR